MSIKKNVLKRMKMLLRFVPEKLYLQIYYFAKFKRFINFKDPKTFNEKMQWLKLYDRNPEYIRMVDKFEVKEYIAEIIGQEYVIPTLGVWDHFDDIDFDELPEQFVLKCTHDSGGLVICKDKRKLDIEKAKKSLQKALNDNFYYIGREWPYKFVKPRIIAEMFLGNESGEELNDYKIMCFNGKAHCTFVCSDRFSTEGLHITVFDKDWNVLPFEREYPAYKQGFEKPREYEKMLQLAEKLAKNISFVRVDFYAVDGQIYFGELTLYPASGFGKFVPEKWDHILGQWIELPPK